MGHNLCTCSILNSYFFFAYQNLLACPNPKFISLAPDKFNSVYKLPPSYTQGLLVYKGVLVVSSGLPTLSRLFVLPSERVLFRLNNRKFGEGIAVNKSKLYWGTLEDGIISLNLNKKLKVSESFDPSLNPQNVWGLTSYNDDILISDGSDVLQFYSTKTWRLIRKLRIKNGKNSQLYLNELETYGNQLLANIYMSNKIVKMDPTSGCTNTIYDLTEFINSNSKNLFYPENEAICPGKCTPRDFVLNGIAYDEKSKALFITGKNWKNVYRIIGL